MLLYPNFMSKFGGMTNDLKLEIKFATTLGAELVKNQHSVPMISRPIAVKRAASAAFGDLAAEALGGIAASLVTVNGRTEQGCPAAAAPPTPEAGLASPIGSSDVLAGAAAGPAGSAGIPSDLAGDCDETDVKDASSEKLPPDGVFDHDDGDDALQERHRFRDAETPVASPREVSDSCATASAATAAPAADEAPPQEPSTPAAAAPPATAAAPAAAVPPPQVAAAALQVATGAPNSLAAAAAAGDATAAGAAGDATAAPQAAAGAAGDAGDSDPVPGRPGDGANGSEKKATASKSASPAGPSLPVPKAAAAAPHAAPEDPLTAEEKKANAAAKRKATLAAKKEAEAKRQKARTRPLFQS